MSGKGNVRFSELFADTVATHGVAWAVSYYSKHGMQCWEFLFWMRATRTMSPV